MKSVLSLIILMAGVSFSVDAASRSSSASSSNSTITPSSKSAPEPGQQEPSSQETLKFKDDHQRAIYNELVAELRCPKCQNQNIADSNAVVAKDMRVKTKQLLDEGYKKEQVIDYMVDRYGQFAHYQPPLNLNTMMLWLLPAVFVFGALWALRRRSQATEDYSPSEEIELNNQLDDELNALLAEKDSDKERS